MYLPEGHGGHGAPRAAAVLAHGARRGPLRRHRGAPRLRGRADRHPRRQPRAGHGDAAERAQRPARGGRLNLSFDRLLLDDGSTVDLSARLVQVQEDIGSGDTVKQGAIGAALGGILGKVIGGTKGAIVGVLLGGAGGAISSSGDDVELPAGTVFTLQLDRATTVPRGLAGLPLAPGGPAGGGPPSVRASGLAVV